MILIFYHIQGTPRYIARAVATGKLLNYLVDAEMFYPIPALTGEAKDAYIKAYGEDMYDEYTDKLIGMAHGCNTSDILPKTPPYFHRPDHDVESIFWVLAFCLIMAKPLNAPDERPQAFIDAWNGFKNHVIIKDSTVDTRSFLLHFGRAGWESTLHSRLAPLAGMMAQLGRQVYPEYGVLSPPPKPDHLHEAFRRILLSQILSMKDDIPLTPNIARRVPSTEFPKPVVQTEAELRGSKKRKAGDDGDSKRLRKSVRSMGGMPASALHSDRYTDVQ